MLSFAHVYRKTARNLDAAGRRAAVQWPDPRLPEKVALLSKLAAVAADYRLKASLCGQPELLAPGLSEARCIDAKRLERAAGHAIEAAHKPHRTRCGCFASRDIGDYDTCPHGCVYCYAVASRERAKARLAHYRPNGESLLTPAGKCQAGS